MKKLKLLMVACALMLGASQSWAQTDVTSTYLVNPSFETLKAADGTTDVTVKTKLTSGLFGWEVAEMSDYQVESSASGSSSGFVNRGSITPTNGDYYYFNRQGWSNKNSELKTTTKTNVEVGTYYLEFNYKAADYSNNNNAGNNGTTIGITVTDGNNETLATLPANKKAYSITNGGSNPGADAYMANAPWSKMGVAFTVETASTLTFAVQQNMKNSGRSDIIYDNFKLYKIDDASSVDFTGYIANPSFEAGNTNGWNIQSGSDVGAKLNSNATYATNGADGNYVFNIWGGNAPYKVSQTIEGLPEGYYAVTALIASDTNQNIQVYCGNGKVYDSSVDKSTGKDITTAVAYVGNGSMEIGATSYSWFKCDNFRLTYLGNSYEASKTNPLAVTDNASLAWNVGGTTTQWGIQLRETYNGSTTNIVQEDLLTQTISGLDNGTYRVRLWAEASNANGVAGDKPEDGTIVAQLYANEATADVGLTTQNQVAGGTLDLYTIDTEVTTHTLKMGMNATANGANWHIIQIENLFYTGPLDMSTYENTYNALVSEAGTAKSTYTTVVGKELTDLDAALSETFDSTSPDAYDDINGRLRTLIDAFIAAAPNYDLLAIEKTKATALGMSAEAIAEATPNTKTGLLALQDLKVAEYNYVTTNYSYSVNLSDTWNSSGENTSAATFSNEHWSGTTHNYMNQNDNNGQGWNANSWKINFNQDVLLPAGKYVFKVAGRQATDTHVTTSLVVTDKSDNSVIGSVNDFPRSNSSRGINKSGATSFNEDASQYANNGKGFGWEWRYVKFELSEEKTINIAVNVIATVLHCWASFGDYTLQTDDPNVEAKLAYNVAIAAANAAYEERNTTYRNVTGEELTALEGAIALDPEGEGNTYQTVTSALNEATSDFTEAKTAYDAYALAKGYGEAINATALPYAKDEKITAVNSAISVAVSTANAAETQTAAINTANRAAYESNALAEKVSNATNVTDLYLANADCSTNTGWIGSFTVGDEIQTNYWTANGESFTDASGNSTNTYLDRNGMTSASFSQTISNLPSGQYIISVTARAQSETTYQMKATNNANEDVTAIIPAIGNTNGVFNRGWNDVTLAFEQKENGEATIAIDASNTEKFWMSFDRIRLIKLDGLTVTISDMTDYTPQAVENVSVSLNRTYKTDAWNTFCVPFDISNEELKAAFGDNVAVATYTESSSDPDNVSIGFNSMDTPSITANVPVLLQPSADPQANIVFPGRTIQIGDAKVEGTNFDFVGNYSVYNEENGYLPAGNYFISDNTFYKATETSKSSLKSTRAYIAPKSSESRLVSIFIDNVETTGINGITNDAAQDGKVYNLSGQQVNKVTKGIFVKNGKKYVVK